MAVNNNLQGKGIGASIMSFAENLARDKGFNKLIMHARKTAIGFYEKFGYKLPHSASSQMNFGQEIRRSELALGDLIFFKTMRSASINHVGIYLGDGIFIHAASGSGRIKIDSVFSRYYNSRYWGARRILVYQSLRNQNSK